MVLAAFLALALADDFFFVAFPEILEDFEDEAVGLDAVDAYGAAHFGGELELHAADFLLVLWTASEWC
jgi:hypothetical protein